MNKISVREAEKHLAGLRADLRTRLELHALRIREARNMNLREEHIDRIRAERDGLERLYQGALDRAKAALQQAQEAEAAENTQAEERRKAVEAETKQRVKREWVRAGGDPNSFDEAWPGLYATLVTEKTLSAMRAENDAKPVVKL